MNNPPCKRTLDISAKDLAPIIKEQIASGKTVTFSPKGVSMLPLIRQGRDSVTLKAVDRPLKRFDIVFYQRDNGHYVLHRIVKLGSTITCIGDNQYEYETGLRPERIFAVVSAVIRDKKTVSVKSLTYRAYCYFWHSSRPLRKLLGKIKRLIIKK